jgi:hypothetical protein
MVAGPRQRSSSLVRVPRDSDLILLSLIGDSPKLEDEIAVFISPKNRVAQLYLQVLGPLFVASYDSRGYRGGIRPRHHTGLQTTS